MLLVWRDGAGCAVSGGISFPPTQGIREKMGDDEGYDFITSHESFGLCPHRTQGVYHYGSAEGELNRNNTQYNFVIKFDRFEDAQELYRRLRAGTIRPDISFEEEQVSSLPLELTIRVIHEYRGWRMTVRMWTRRFVAWWGQRATWLQSR